MTGVKVIPIGKPRTVRLRLLEALGDLLARQGFDGLSLESGENSLFGTETVAARHFTSYGASRGAPGGAVAEEIDALVDDAHLDQCP